MNKSAIFSYKISSKVYIIVKDLEDLEDLIRSGREKIRTNYLDKLSLLVYLLSYYFS
jgi:hypothetical protein